MSKTSWAIFVDLLCPDSRECWERLPAIRQRFESRFDITVYYTSLAFHPQSFTAQCAANLIGGTLGEDARYRFQDTCFTRQEEYMYATKEDADQSEIDFIFCNIAEEAGCFNEKSNALTREDFLAQLHDWERSFSSAWKEQEIALAQGAFSAPSHVIDGKLVPDAHSSWGADEWEIKLSSHVCSSSHPPIRHQIEEEVLLFPI